MKKLILSILVICCLVIAGCGNATKDVNPVAEFCKDNGGKFKSSSNMCFFDNDIKCDALDFFEGKCAENVVVHNVLSCVNAGGKKTGLNKDQCEFEGFVFVEGLEKINLAECDGYFDGCNNCFVGNNQLVGCTRKFCVEFETPSCVVVDAASETDSSNDVVTDEPKVELTIAEKCGFKAGRWLDAFNECEFITQESCDELGGTYAECESACRHYNDPDMACTTQCVQVCKLE